MKKSRWCFQVPRGYWRKSWKIARMFSVLMCTLTFSVSATAFAGNFEFQAGNGQAGIE